MLRTWILLAAIASLAAFAAFDALRGGPSGEPVETATTAGAETSPASAGPPRPSLLAAGRLGGTLWLETREGCRLGVVRLADLRPGGLGPRTGCGLWVAPNGRLAVVPRGRAPLGGVRPLALVRFSDRPALGATLGRVRGEASWSADSRRVAWCDRAGTVVLELASGRRERVSGCRPKLAPGGRVLTRPDRPLATELWRDGQVLLGEADLRAGFGQARAGLIDVLGYDAGPRRLVAVSAVHFVRGREPRVVLQLWRGRRHVATLALAGFGEPTGPFKGLGRVAETVEFSPDGREVAVVSHETGLKVRVFEVRSRREVMRRETQRAVDWSPDGVWLVLSTGDELLFYGAARGAPEHVLPLAVRELAWRP